MEKEVLDSKIETRSSFPIMHHRRRLLLLIISGYMNTPSGHHHLVTSYNFEDLSKVRTIRRLYDGVGRALVHLELLRLWHGRRMAQYRHATRSSLRVGRGYLLRTSGQGTGPRSNPFTTGQSRRDHTLTCPHKQ